MSEDFNNRWNNSFVADCSSIFVGLFFVLIKCSNAEGFNYNKNIAIS